MDTRDFRQDWANLLDRRDATPEENFFPPDDRIPNLYPAAPPSRYAGNQEQTDTYFKQQYALPDMLKFLLTHDSYRPGQSQIADKMTGSPTEMLRVGLYNMLAPKSVRDGPNDVNTMNDLMALVEQKKGL